MKYSIVIATYNRAGDLAQTLDSLAGLRPDGPWEVIVVDNNSTDATRQVVEDAARTFPVELHYVFEREQGRSPALNTGIRAARGAIVATTDDDVRVPADWLNQAAAGLERLGCGYVGGRVLPIWGGPRPTWLPDHGGKHWAVIALLDYGPEPIEFGARVPLGVNMAFAREAFDRAGLFDPAIGRRAGTLLGQEVREWCIRAREAGITGYYIPSMAVQHIIPAARLTRRYFRRWFYWRGISRAMLYQRSGLDMEAPEQSTLDFAKVPHVLGVPRYLYRRALTHIGGWIRDALRRRPLESFSHELWLWFFAGILRQRLRDRPAGAPRFSPPAPAMQARQSGKLLPSLSSPLPTVEAGPLSREEPERSTSAAGRLKTGARFQLLPFPPRCRYRSCSPTERGRPDGLSNLREDFGATVKLRHSFVPGIALAMIAMLGISRNASAADILCDPSFQDCRARIIQLIQNERVAIDVAFWFMEDARYTAELKKKKEEGVAIRVLVDPRANTSNPLNANRLAELQAAGIPMRKRTASGILHWKVMLFDGQNTVQFSAANYSPEAFVPVTPYQNYTDEVIYTTDEASIVNSFRTKYDSIWTNTSNYANYANVTGPLMPRYGSFPKNSELNFPPLESFRSRSVARYNAENEAIDVIMYRITDAAHADAIIAARQRGVPVRLITEPQQYRDSGRLWHSWNVDRLYMAGVQIKHRAHQGLLHQKSTILHGQGMTIFGSSNWTSPSSSSQEEHNYFTTKANFFQYFTDQFERKWNNSNPAGATETTPFVPLPPDPPSNVSPADHALNQPTSSVTLKWIGGYWAHVYDVYFGTSPNPPLFAPNLELGPSESANQTQQLTVTGLQPGTLYYWKVVSKTAANLTRTGVTYSFTTAGMGAPPPPNGELGPGDVNLYAMHATTIQGAWQVVSDTQAAGAARIFNPDAGRAKVITAAANPANYFDMTFTAEAGRPYRLWIRGRAQDNDWANDSVHVQFSDSVNASGTPVFRIGTTSSTEVNLEDGKSAGLSGWGWQDNGYGVGILGPAIYFAATGTHTIRVQMREDGISIDQILLSPQKFLNSSPGAVKNDTKIYPENGGTGAPPPPPPPPPGDGEIVLYASTATITDTQWSTAADASAAGGSVVRTLNQNAAKVVTALSSPASYVELTFNAEANTPYRLWMRMKAQGNTYSNDSVHVQFSNTVDSGGAGIYRIGTTSSAEVNLEDCSGCGVSNWGWQDNGYGTGVLGPLLTFSTAGTQTIRIQNREDGVSIDQIVLSPEQYLTTAPGALKNDSTILPASNGN